MKFRIAAFVVVGVALLGATLHAAGVEVGGECILCAVCPFC